MALDEFLTRITDEEQSNRNLYFQVLFSDQ